MITKKSPSEACNRATLLAFDLAVEAAGDCPHGVYGGAVVRPWCDTPGCPGCRRHRSMWRSVTTARSYPTRPQYFLDDEGLA